MKRRVYSLVALTLLFALLLSGCGLGKDRLWRVSYDLGNRYLSQGNYEAAILAFTAAIEIDPRRVEAYVSRAGTYTAVGNYSAARADYVQAAELAPENSAVQEALAELDVLEGIAPQSTPTPSAAPTSTPAPTAVPEPTPTPTPETGIRLVNPELPLVYDVFYETAETYYGEISIRLPCINLAGADSDAINQEIWNRYFQEGQSSLNASEEYYSSLRSVDYSWSCHGKILSLVVTARYDDSGGDWYEPYNLDTETGTRLSDAALLAACGVEEAAFYAGVRERLEAEAVWAVPEDLEQTLAEENIRSVRVYLDESGALCFAANVYVSAGAGCYPYTFVW